MIKTLRSMIDDRTLFAAMAAPPAASAKTGNPKPKAGSGSKSMSPGANHIISHLNDPTGMTKPGFQDLTKKKLDYDQARENMQRELAGPQAVIDHLSNIHGLVPGGMPGQLPTPGMTPGTAPGMQDPNAVPGQNPDEELGMDETQPGNMNPAMTQNPTKQMNQGRPSVVGNQPGVAPGDQKTVVPKKMGVPTPAGGGPTAAGMPTKPPLAKRAAPPAGNKSLPGAKGPGDPKVANPIKKAQSGTTGRQIKINVAANQAPGASKTIANSRGMAVLKFGVNSTPGEMMAGPASLSDKVSDPGDAVAYNPKFNAGHGKDCDCSACSKKMRD